MAAAVAKGPQSAYDAASGLVGVTMMAEDNKQILCNMWHITDEILPPEDEDLLIYIDGELHFGHASVYGRPGESQHVTWFCQEGGTGYYGYPDSTDYPGTRSLWMLPAPPPAELLDKIPTKPAHPWGITAGIPDPALAGLWYNPETCSWEKPKLIKDK